MLIWRRWAAGFFHSWNSEAHRPSSKAATCRFSGLLNHSKRSVIKYEFNFFFENCWLEVNLLRMNLSIMINIWKISNSQFFWSDSDRWSAHWSRFCGKAFAYIAYQKLLLGISYCDSRTQCIFLAANSRLTHERLQLVCLQSTDQIRGE